jgi:hypothetical protein
MVYATRRALAPPLLLVLSIVVTGCGWNDSPARTTKAVTAQDVVGTWKYFTYDRKTSITIAMAPDGTLNQTITPPMGSKMTASGTWELQGSLLLLKLPLLMDVNNSWKPHEAIWLLIDSKLNTGHLALAGGVFNDPDCYSEFVRLP